MFCRSLFVLFLLPIVLSVLLRYTVSDCPFGIFKLFSILHRDATIKDNIITWKTLPYFRTDLSFFFILLILKRSLPLIRLCLRGKVSPDKDCNNVASVINSIFRLVSMIIQSNYFIVNFTY
jgi:hypothetical protein